MAVKQFKDRVWLKRKTPCGKWTYGLVRLKTGEIVVAECYSGGVFAVAGCGGLTEKEDAHRNKLYRGQKHMIVVSLKRACDEWLESHDK